MLPHPLGVAATGTGAAASPGSWTRNLASQDWLLMGYLVVILGALLLGKGPNRSACFLRVSADLAIFLLVLVLVRGQVLRWGGAASSLLYRTTVIGVLLGSFFQLREILPAVSPWADDARIYSIDVNVFGFEPAVTMDAFVTPQTTEWFAFFYFLYFLILCVHILPMVYLQRDTNLLASFATGVLLVFLTAHLVYMVVPGLGPYWYLHATFHHQLEGQTFWPLVRQTVDAGGPQKDIFPSLHTAVPTYFALFSFRHRKIVPFKYTWPAIAFLATQIIIATMFLRWHYLLDVVAGLVLAATGALIGLRLADWERAKRERLRLQPVWMPLAYPWSR
ncbi:MAG: phosphatase PAP2 family protein [Myxococcota bacterium]|nr:phosphatase PAP2 family protein [Myxococcota bacterium]